MKEKTFVEGKQYIFIPCYPNPNHVEIVKCLGIEDKRIYIRRPGGRDSTTREFLTPLPAPYKEPEKKEEKPIVYADFCDTCFNKENKPDECDNCIPTNYPKLCHDKKTEWDGNNHLVKKRKTKVQQYPYRYFRKGMTVKQIMARMKRTWSGYHWAEKSKTKDIYKDILSLYAVAQHYEAVLGFPVRDTMEVMEAKGGSSLGHRYSNRWGRITKGAYVFETEEDFKEQFPSGKYRCGRCGGISTNQTRCNSGKYMHGKEVCNWATFGLFGPMKPYIGYIIKNGSAAKMVIRTSFAPIELEHVHK